MLLIPQNYMNLGSTRYQRTQSRMISASKWRHLNSDIGSLPCREERVYNHRAKLLQQCLSKELSKMAKTAITFGIILTLLGLIGTGIRVFPQLFGEVANPSAFTVQLIMTLLCLIFVILAVKSFIDARRNREN